MALLKQCCPQKSYLFKEKKNVIRCYYHIIMCNIKNYEVII